MKKCSAETEPCFVKPAMFRFLYILFVIFVRVSSYCSLLSVLLSVLGELDIKSEHKRNPRHQCVTFSELETLTHQQHRMALLGHSYQVANIPNVALFAPPPPPTPPVKNKFIYFLGRESKLS